MDETSNSSPTSSESTTVTKRPLLWQLRLAIAYFGAASFLPLDELETHLTREAVSQKLQLRLPDLSDEELNSTTALICDPPPDAQSNSHGQASLRRKILFAILVLINRTGQILDFIREDVRDTDLPLNAIRRSVLHKRLELRENKYLDDDNGLFERTQWLVLAPFFSRDPVEPPGEKISFYLLDNLPLPFIGFHSHDGLQCVEIHAGQHSFPVRQHGKSLFAIRCVKAEDKSSFDKDLARWKLLSNSDNLHLVQILATFELNEVFYIITPWADGNLFDFWATHPQPIRSEGMTNWIATQCLGIASGLNAIHQMVRITAPSPHGHISPLTVLWFKDDNSSLHFGSLKITDIDGLEIFRPRRASSAARPPRVDFTAYTPPKWELIGHVEDPRRRWLSWDIWMIGCLFLDFAT